MDNDDEKNESEGNDSGEVVETTSGSRKRTKYSPVWK